MKRASSRRTFLRNAAALALFAFAPLSARAADPDFRARATNAWRGRIRSILAKGELPIIDTEVTYNTSYDLDFILRNMDALNVAQICPAPAGQLGSGASLELYTRHPEYFIPTTTDGSSPHWYRDTQGFAAQLQRDLGSGHYFLMGEFELRHYPSPNQYRAGRLDRDVTVPLDDPGVRAVFQLAERTGIALQIHYEIEDALLPALESLLERHPRAKVIWCHLGQVRYPDRSTRYGPAYVRELIKRFPNLYFDLGLPGPPHVHPASRARDQMIYTFTGYRPWGGFLRREWRELLEDSAERFLAASDIGGDRFREFPDQILRLRQLVLNELSPRAQHLIAYQNAWRLITGERWES